MKNLQLKMLKDRLMFYSTIVFEIVETIASLVIAKRLPNLIGTVSIVLILLIGIEMNTGRSKNPFIQDHTRLFSFLFLISSIVCICALLTILVLNGPSAMMHTGKMNNL